MSDICSVCGRTESEAIEDARAVGLKPEFQAALYTCCQIAEWAHEQALAWFEATQEDSESPGYGNATPEPSAVFVPVRSSRPQVPWYRNPNDRR